MAGDAFGHVSLSVCLSVCLVEGLDVETSFLVYKDIFRMSSSYIKVVGQDQGHRRRKVIPT